MLKINDLHVRVKDENIEILKGLNLTIRPGEVHAIMGPNGAGKSTLSSVLAGDKVYVVTHGSITFNGKNLLSLSVEERALSGLLIGFQHPVEIPGVKNIYFIRAALNAKRIANGESEIAATDFMKLVKNKLALLKMDNSFLQRDVNDGLSGGEKKRNEILHMLLLEPKLALLDEIDSGIDIDAIKIIADGVNDLRSMERSILLVTHYQRLLNYIEPDYVHILIDGRIIKSGDKLLAQNLEAYGYADYMKI